MGDIKNPANRSFGVPKIQPPARPNPQQVSELPVLQRPTSKPTIDKLGLTVGGDFSLELPPFDPGELAKADGAVDGSHDALVKSIGGMTSEISAAQTERAVGEAKVAEISVDRERLSGQIGRLESKTQQLQVEQDRLMGEIEKGSGRLKHLSGEADRLLKENKALKAESGMISVAIQQRSEKRQTLQDFTWQHGNTYSKLSSKPAGQLSAKERAFVSQYESAEKQIASHTQEIERLSTKSKQLQVGIRTNDQTIQQHQREIQGIQTYITHSTQAIKANQQELAKVRTEQTQLRGQIQSLDGQLAANRQRLESLEAKVSELQVRRAEVVAKGVGREQQEIHLDQTTLKALEAQLADLEKELAAATSTISTLSARKQALVTKQVELETQSKAKLSENAAIRQERLNSEKTLKQNNTQLASLQKEALKLERVIQQRRPLPPAELQQVQAQLAEVKRQISVLQTENRGLQQQIGEAEQTIKKNEKILKEISSQLKLYQQQALAVDRQLKPLNEKHQGLTQQRDGVSQEISRWTKELAQDRKELAELQGMPHDAQQGLKQASYDETYLQLTQAVASQQSVALGPYPVKTEYAALQDPARPERGNIPVKVQYPEGEGPFPTVILSHGAGGDMEAFNNLGNFLASQGYVVMHPTHHDSEAARTLAKQGYPKAEIPNLLLSSPQERAYRPQDISFLIDSMENGALTQQLPGLEGKADLTNIGVAGHSFGGYTVMAVAGAMVDLPGAPDTSFKDDRVSMAIALDPARFQTGVDAGASTAIDVPVAVMYSTKAQERGGYFDEMPPGDKYDFRINGAGHEAYGDSGPPPVQAATMATSLAMFDAYLKDQAQSAAWLQTGGISTTRSDMVDFERK